MGVENNICCRMPGRPLSSGLSLLCSGLGAAAVLAPFGIARLRSPASIRNPAAASRDPAAPLSSPEEAACRMLQDRLRVFMDGESEPQEELRHRVGYRPMGMGKEAARSEYLSMWAKDRNLKIIETKAE